MAVRYVLAFAASLVGVACTSGTASPGPVVPSDAAMAGADVGRPVLDTCPDSATAAIAQSGAACPSLGQTCAYECSADCAGNCECLDSGWLCGCPPCPTHASDD